jgi:hypothetical protein
MHATIYSTPTSTTAKLLFTTTYATTTSTTTYAIPSNATTTFSTLELKNWGRGFRGIYSAESF